MHVLLRCLILSLALAVVGGTAARAANPRITLKLEDVAGTEAVSALSKAAEIPIDLPESLFDPQGKVAAQLRERSTFNWNSIRFAAALRELCIRYNLRVQRTPAGSYTLYPALPPVPPPARRVGLMEKDGVRLFVRRITISNNREINFDEAPVGMNPGSMGIQVGGELLDGDAEAIAGFANVAAKDDLGNLLTSDQNGFRLGRWGGGVGAGGYPDEFSDHLQLPAPHPKARKLVWLEGELLTHKTVRPLTVEIPLPLPAQGGRKEAHGMLFEVTRVEAEPEPPDNPLPVPANNVSVQARMIWATGGRISPRADSGTASVALRGASGKLYAQASGGSGGGGGGGRITYNYNLTFHRVNEPVTAVVFSLVEKSDPEPILSFRMTDIPLPGDPAFVPRRATTRPVQPARPGTPAAERPFYAQGGGTLNHRIQIAGQPAPEGTLSVGLAAKEGTGWGAMRWTEVPVSKEGVASLTDLKPGTYRLLRVYQMKEAPQVRTDGAWQNAEVTIEVVAGKETAAPPLSWGPLPVPSAPRAKPAGSPPSRRR